MNPFAVVISDLHFRSDGRTLPNRNIPFGDLEYSLSQVNDFMREFEYTIPVIVAGDVFDTKTCHSTMLLLARRFFSGGFPTYFVQGQHDATVPPWLNLIDPKSVHLHRTSVIINGFRFVGFDYCYKLEELDSFLSEHSKKPPYVLVTHFPFFFVDGSFEVLEKYDNLLVVISGDYHVPVSRVLRNGTRFYSVGACNPNRINDTNNYSFLALSRDASGLVVKEIPFQTRKVINETIKDLDELKELEDSIHKIVNTAPASVIAKPIVVVRCSDMEVLAAARRQLDPICHLFIRPVSEVEPVVGDIAPNSELSMEDLKSVLKRHYSQSMGPEFVNVVASLFEACKAAGSPRLMHLRHAIKELWDIFENRKEKTCE